VGAAWRGAFAKAPPADRASLPARSAVFTKDLPQTPASMPAPANDAAGVASLPPSSEPPSAIERVYAHRENLFACAVQLLDDVHAAQQVVNETIEKALLSVKDKDFDAGPNFERSLDRLLLSLSLVRLKALPPSVLPGPPRSSASAGDRGSDRITDRASDRFSDRASDRFSDRFSDRASEKEPSEAEVGEGGQFARTAQVLTSLPVEARVAVTLVVMQGRSLAEAALLLGTSEPTCRFFLNHGRKLLRRALQRDLLTSDGEGRAGALLEKLTSGTTTLHDLRRSKKATIRA
jgi:DNA-directed RNA polymerase specialized sigma24 family protein